MVAVAFCLSGGYVKVGERLVPACSAFFGEVAAATRTAATAKLSTE